MTVAGWVALSITILGACGYAAASILQAVAARRSTSTVRTLAHPLYLAGLGCDIFAWLGAMIALRQLAVYLVESVLAGSLALTVVAARIFLKSSLRRTDIVAVVISVGALAVLAMSAGQQHSVLVSPPLRIGFCAAAATTALLAWGTAKFGPPGAIAALAGLSLGGASLAGRALAIPPEAMGRPASIALAVVTEPMTAAVLTFAATGMLLYANALQRGQVGPMTAVLWTAEVIVPSAVALVLLGDTVRPGWGLAALIAALVTVASAVVLATAPAHNETALPPDALPSPAPRPALPALARATLLQSAVEHCAERVIWWGSPPVWVPPERAEPAQPARAALTWAAGQSWTQLRPVGAGPAEAPLAVTPDPAPVHWPARQIEPAYEAERHPVAPRPAGPRPWFDL